VFEVHRGADARWGDAVHVRFHDGTEVAEKSDCFEVVSAAR
jgi:hypothetical protein